MVLMFGTFRASVPTEMVTVKTPEVILESENYVFDDIKPACVYRISDEDLLAMITMAEAEGESELGKRLVIDTILNRVDADRYPDNVLEVIYQSGQFSSITNGRCDRIQATSDIYALVREELANRTNSEVLYFTANHYGKYGTPVFSVGNHYFCK